MKNNRKKNNFISIQTISIDLWLLRENMAILSYINKRNAYIYMQTGSPTIIRYTHLRLAISYITISLDSLWARHRQAAPFWIENIRAQREWTQSDYELELRQHHHDGICIVSQYLRFWTMTYKNIREDLECFFFCFGVKNDKFIYIFLSVGISVWVVRCLISTTDKEIYYIVELLNCVIKHGAYRIPNVRWFWRTGASAPYKYHHMNYCYCVYTIFFLKQKSPRLQSSGKYFIRCLHMENYNWTMVHFIKGITE